MKSYFTTKRHIKYEIFCDWLPTDNCFINLDSNVKDKWGTPVLRVRVGYHAFDLKVVRYLAKKANNVLKALNLENIHSRVSGSAPKSGSRWM